MRTPERRAHSVGDGDSRRQTRSAVEPWGLQGFKPAENRQRVIANARVPVAAAASEVISVCAVACTHSTRVHACHASHVAWASLSARGRLAQVNYFIRKSPFPPNSDSDLAWQRSAGFLTRKCTRPRESLRSPRASAMLLTDIHRAEATAVAQQAATVAHQQQRARAEIMFTSAKEELQKINCISEAMIKMQRGHDTAIEATMRGPDVQRAGMVKTQPTFEAIESEGNMAGHDGTTEELRNCVVNTRLLIYEWGVSMKKDTERLAEESIGRVRRQQEQTKRLVPPCEERAQTSNRKVSELSAECAEQSFSEKRTAGRQAANFTNPMACRSRKGRKT